MQIPADKLVAAYVRIRDAKSELQAKFDEDMAKLDADLSRIEAALLDICKTTGQDGGKTSAGSFHRTVTTRYWTSDWASMREFIKKHDALDLMEQRIHQTNMKEFLRAHPNAIPAGLNADSRMRITVRRATER